MKFRRRLFWFNVTLGVIATAAIIGFSYLIVNQAVAPKPPKEKPKKGLEPLPTGSNDTGNLIVK